jgi:hypothetical protein
VPFSTTMTAYTVCIAKRIYREGKGSHREPFRINSQILETRGADYIGTDSELNVSYNGSFVDAHGSALALHLILGSTMMIDDGCCCIIMVAACGLRLACVRDEKTSRSRRKIYKTSFHRITSQTFDTIKSKRSNI